MNKKFFTAHTLRRPFITLKWAESADGYIDGKISTPLTSVLVHELRATHDAILVGSNTFLIDNPGLDNRLFAGKSPRRVVLDRRGRIEKAEGVDVLSGYPSLGELVGGMYHDGITSLLVEGGSEVLGSFIADGLWDEIRVEKSLRVINGNVSSPILPHDARLQSVRKIDGNTILNYIKS